jgi:hypothetical protein
LHQNHGFSKNQVPYIILTYWWFKKLE